MAFVSSITFPISCTLVVTCIYLYTAIRVRIDPLSKIVDYFYHMVSGVLNTEIESVPGALFSVCTLDRDSIFLSPFSG